MGRAPEFLHAHAEPRGPGHRTRGALDRDAAAIAHHLNSVMVAVDVDAVIADLHHQLLAHTVDADIALVVRSYGGLPSVMADRGQLDCVLLDLMVNAREAMPGGGTRTIQADAVQVGDDGSATHPGLLPGEPLGVTVTDSGIGMAADVAAQALDSSFTTKVPGAGTVLLPVVGSAASVR